MYCGFSYTELEWMTPKRFDEILKKILVIQDAEREKMNAQAAAAAASKGKRRR